MWQLTGLPYCLFIAVILLLPVILSLCASSLALLLLAANQYLAICNPLFAQARVSPGRAGLCIVAAWMTSATAAALPALLMLMVHYSDERRVCTDYTNSMANKSLEVSWLRPTNHSLTASPSSYRLQDKIKCFMHMMLAKTNWTQCNLRRTLRSLSIYYWL